MMSMGKVYDNNENSIWQQWEKYIATMGKRLSSDEAAGSKVVCVTRAPQAFVGKSIMMIMLVMMMTTIMMITMMMIMMTMMSMMVLKVYTICVLWHGSNHIVLQFIHLCFKNDMMRMGWVCLQIQFSLIFPNQIKPSICIHAHMP